MKHFLFLAVLMLVGIATALDAQTITTFDLPNSTKTVPRAIDLFGQTAGYYQDATGTYGFLRQRDGTFTSFAADPSNAHSRTFVTDMNSAGQIIGFIEQASGGWTGFLRETDGTIVQFNGTGTISAPSVAIAPEPQPPPCCPDGTSAIAINEFGQITGTYGSGGPLRWLSEAAGRHHYRLLCKLKRAGRPVYNSTSHKPPGSDHGVLSRLREQCCFPRLSAAAER